MQPREAKYNPFSPNLPTSKGSTVAHAVYVGPRNTIWVENQEFKNLLLDHNSLKEKNFLLVQIYLLP